MTQIKATILESLKNFPCLLITSPRNPFTPNDIISSLPSSYVVKNLESPDTLASAEENPQLFLQHGKNSFILEEIQNSHTIVDAIQKILEDPDEKDKYILTSSLSIKELQPVFEKLSGKIAYLHLLPSYFDKQKVLKNTSPFSFQVKEPEGAVENISTFVFQGYFKNSHGTQEWYKQRLQRFYERDLPKIRNIENVADFQNFLKKLTHYNGSQLNMAQMGRDLGISLNTVKAWVSALENSFMITLTKPFRRDCGIRLKKTSTLHFMDTGLMCYLLNLQPDTLEKSPQYHSMIESILMNELRRFFAQKGEFPPISIWNPSSSTDSYIIIETINHIYLFEVSFKAKVNIKEYKNLNQLQQLFNKKLKIFNIHTENIVRKIDDDILTLPFSAIKDW